jgi:hypothetical protein
MASMLALLHKYTSLFRRMINTRVQSSDRSIRDLLRLNTDSDWEFLTTAMDIVDDASAAIDHVQRFGLSGSTKYGDLGEKYLRLYGLLSATYIQQQSMGTIFRIMNLPDPKALKAKFEGLEIRDLRHKLSSHGTDFRDNITGTKQAFVPIRFDLGDFRISYVNYTSSTSHHTVDIATAIEAHVRLMIETMDSIIEKSLTTIFESSSKQKDELEAELADLRIGRAGGLVFKTDAGPKLVVTFAGTKPE